MIVAKVVTDGRLTYQEYKTLHGWVKRKLGKPQVCVECKTVSGAQLEWANISKDYRRDITDWESLCASCHRRKDLFGKADECRKGHKLTADNLYIYPNGRSKECKTCRAEHHKVSNAKAKPNKENE